ncbi:polysaccharide biosynthesis/export family protein [Pedobacter sandarakinus]|uniref:polysaccharide biosynthesis/export family protein n=1 Tax=Pedobacter sandarakinus TaxID=353156 RepID=UPI002246F555|nr:polysaccharide biosynthesis/export family protein [Pedobacter sandarakinus]MCX2575941.1 polysaccharide biosynthesis/export family protein [Pedobacter sandarakinus]
MQKAKRFIFFIPLVAVIFFSSCSLRRERALFNAPTDLVTDTLKQVYVVNDQGIGDLYYRIKANDLLAVRNVQNPEFGAVGGGVQGQSGSSSAGNSSSPQSYQVELDGKVNLPAIGKVAVAGLTRREAAIKLQDLYQAKLLKDPIIEVNIINLKVTLLGEFARQGNFLLEKDNTTLIDIIGEAGGISKTADPKSLKIIRGDRANPEIIYVNLNDINSLASKKLILQNNDILYLQTTKSAALSEKMQSINSLVQPLLVVINVALLILTVTK